MEREHTRELSMQVAAAQGVIGDLQRRGRTALEEARRSEAKLQAVIDKARLDHEEFQAAAERARHDAEELARLRGEHEALQKTVECIRRERHQALQDRVAERAKKEEAEKVAADLGAEAGNLCSQVQGLQTAVSQGADRERELKAWVDAFGVFGSHYSGINFAGMSKGYAAGYSEAELDEIDAAVFTPAEALAKLLEEEAVPPADPPSS
uniref:Uncharacterized protein n=1 Tax=Setaria viridis TaxID=4556 RepID=A0A4U6VCE2_SETVI|nr:hypothetical protein SEVIR_3G235000v2 [Setaria viridis]